MPWVGNWRWYSWDSVPHKVTAESPALHSPFKRLTQEKKCSSKGFIQLIPSSRAWKARKEEYQAGSEAMLDPGSSLFPFSVWNNQKGNSAIILSLCTMALGNVHVLSTKHLFPCSPRGSLGGRVVWFISLNCQLMNGTRPSTATHSEEKSPYGCTSWEFSHSH